MYHRKKYFQRLTVIGKRSLACLVAMTATAVLLLSVFAEGEAELLDRNRNQGIGDKSYAEIITEATADISFEEQEKTVKNIEICAEEYELVYEYYFDDLQTFPKTQYDEIIKKSRGIIICVPVTGEVEGVRKLVGQISIHCKNSEISKVETSFAQIFTSGKVNLLNYDFLEQRALLDDITAACKEKGATQITDAFLMRIDCQHFIIRAMIIETDIGMIAYEFGYNDTFDASDMYNLSDFVVLIQVRAENITWTFWDFARWYGYLPIIIPAVVFLLLAIIVVTVILIIKKSRKQIIAAPPEAEE